MPIDFRRRETAKRMLEIDWHHPVFAPDLEQEVEEGRTTTGAAFVALPRERAFLEIRDESDVRPLLVMRECDLCKGSDAALLSRKIDNERTVLMAAWFRCVKLPNDVLDADHPFRNLFETDHPPHVYLADPDGSNVLTFDGNQSQRILWEAMEGVIERHYEKDPERALKGLRRLLDKFDEVDIREDELRRRRDDEVVEHGRDSPKVRKLERKLEELAREREELEAQRAKLLDLGLRRRSKASD